jgi:hypothetical protein
MILLLIKHHLITGHTDSSHYAGGIHLCSCIASALAASGAFSAVHTLSTVPSKAVLLHHAVTHGLLPQLRSKSHGLDIEVVSWQQAPALHHTVVVGSSAGALLAAAADAVHKLSAAGQAGCVLLDIDTLQHAQVPAAPAWPTDSSRQPPQQYPCSSHNATVPFMLGLANVLRQQPAPAANTGQHHPQHAAASSPSSPWPLLALVQNIHHLPFGPCGTSPRSAAVLQGWQSVQGVLCVSGFVRSYCEQHALPLLPQLQQQPIHQQQLLHVAHPAAFKVWGEGPFEDLGSRAAAQIWGHHQPGNQQQPHQQHNQQQQHQQQQGARGNDTTTGAPSQPQTQQQVGWQQAPVVGVLKLTQEKGSELLLALAASLLQLQFKAVCADPWVKQEVASRQQAGGLSNLQLVPPTGEDSSEGDRQQQRGWWWPTGR